MKFDHAQLLWSRHPRVFEKDKIYPYVGVGWFELLDNLCGQIEEELEDGEAFAVTQIKQKFGGLRFYVYPCPDRIYDMIHEAERQSWHICEVCGAQAVTINDQGGITWRTRCEEHKDLYSCEDSMASIGGYFKK